MAAMFFFHLSCVCLRRPQADALTLWSCFQGLRTPTPVSPNDNDSLETLCNYFCDLIGKIQKAALNSKAGDLDTLLRNTCQLPATVAWEILMFSLLGTSSTRHVPVK